MKIFLAVVILIVLFLGYVSTRKSVFRYERSGVINAPPEKIYPYISNLKMGSVWNSYEKVDPNLKKTFAGVDGQVGSSMEFSGNREAGAGKLEILKLVPNQSAQIKLLMTKPFTAVNIIDYTLIPESPQTRFSWTMSGDGGFLGKLVGTFIDCEKIVAGPMVKGIANLKAVVEAR